MTKSLRRWTYLSLLVLSGLWSSAVLAADQVIFTPSISIPGSQFQAGQNVVVTGATKTICDYIIAYYKYGIGILAVLAVIVIAVAGLSWVMSGGNPGKINKAKSRITDAIFGIAVALFSFVILSTINKELVICKNFTLPTTNYKEAELASNASIEPTCKIVAFSSSVNATCPNGYTHSNADKCVRSDGSLAGNPADGSGATNLCCCPSNTMELSTFCTQAGEGASCKVNGSWGYCENIDGKGLICRPCKSITSRTQQNTVKASDFKETERCYRNVVDWECPGDNGMCGADGVNAGSDCNMMAVDSSGKLSTAIGPLDSCWSTDLLGRTFICVCQ